MSPNDAQELADMYLAPEAAAALILRACDASAPELQRRTMHALRWLDPEDEDPPLRFSHGGAGDVLARAVTALCHALIYHSDAATRRRCQGLMAAVVAEAARVGHVHEASRCA